MLIRFSIENWTSFQSKSTVSLIATRERRHRERIPKIEEYKLGVLPVAAVYGGNASGKTNLFQALAFAKHLIVRGTKPDEPIAVEMFKLAKPQIPPQPTRFQFELLADERVYDFSFSITREAIVEEKLVFISGATEKTLYHRREGIEDPNFDPSLQENAPLSFAFKGTRDNQLFLTNSISQKIETFKPVHNWFQNNLKIIGTRSSFHDWIDEEHSSYSTMNEMLSQLDTGIARLGTEKQPSTEAIGGRGNPKEPLITARKTVRTLDRIMSIENSELVQKKLVFYHLNSEGEEIPFEIEEESEGSQRLLDLLPYFLALSASQSNKVYAIDEIDRSLHTLLIKSLLEHYLSSCSRDSRAQLLFTTHNLSLMDQKLLRRDELWITERNAQGRSNVWSLSEYKEAQRDRDIRKSYLQGRLGGIPKILL